jgi:hypothetical protein
MRHAWFDWMLPPSATSTMGLVAVVLVAACGDSRDTSSADRAALARCTAPTAAPAWLDVFLAERVAKLTGADEIAPGLRLPDRATPERRRIARSYLRDELSSLGIATHAEGLDSYGEGANVVGRLAATADSSTEWIVVGAHFDSEPGSPGADDNATGVAVVLAVARTLRDVPCRSRGVMFVMFDQEERGLLGSAAFADRERAAGMHITAAHTIDQVGWDGDGDRTFEIQRPTLELFAEYEAGAAAVGAKVVETKTAGTDHQTFRARGYAAVGVSEEYVAGDTTPHGHLPGDTSRTVNAAYHALAARLVTYVVASELGAP